MSRDATSTDDPSPELRLLNVVSAWIANGLGPSGLTGPTGPSLTGLTGPSGSARAGEHFWP